MKNRIKQRANRKMRLEERLKKCNNCGIKDLTAYNAVQQIRTNGKAAIFFTTTRGEQIIMERTTMSVQELSAQMGISLPKAYELVKTPGFPTLRIGTRILIPIDAYKEWLMKQSVKN